MPPSMSSSDSGSKGLYDRCLDYLKYLVSNGSKCPRNSEFDFWLLRLAQVFPIADARTLDASQPTTISISSTPNAVVSSPRALAPLPPSTSSQRSSKIDVTSVEVSHSSVAGPSSATDSSEAFAPSATLSLSESPSCSLQSQHQPQTTIVTGMEHSSENRPTKRRRKNYNPPDNTYRRITRSQTKQSTESQASQKSSSVPPSSTTKKSHHKRLKKKGLPVSISADCIPKCDSAISNASESCRQSAAPLDGNSSASSFTKPSFNLPPSTRFDSPEASVCIQDPEDQHHSLPSSSNATLGEGIISEQKLGKRPASALDDDNEEYKMSISPHVDHVNETRDQDAFVPSSSSSEAVMPFVSEKMLGKRKALNECDDNPCLALVLFSPAVNEALTSIQPQVEPLLQEFPLGDRTITAEGLENFDEDEQSFISVDRGSNNEDDDEVASFFEEAATAGDNPASDDIEMSICRHCRSRSNTPAPEPISKQPFAEWRDVTANEDMDSDSDEESAPRMSLLANHPFSSPPTPSLPRARAETRDVSEKQLGKRRHVEIETDVEDSGYESEAEGPPKKKLCIGELGLRRAGSIVLDTVKQTVVGIVQNKTRSSPALSNASTDTPSRFSNSIAGPSRPAPQMLRQQMSVALIPAANPLSIQCGVRTSDNRDIEKNQNSCPPGAQQRVGQSGKPTTKRRPPSQFPVCYGFEHLARFPPAIAQKYMRLPISPRFISPSEDVEASASARRRQVRKPIAYRMKSPWSLKHPHHKDDKDRRRKCAHERRVALCKSIVLSALQKCTRRSSLNVDVDELPENPLDFILTLPEHIWFKVGRMATIKIDHHSTS